MSSATSCIPGFPGLPQGVPRTQDTTSTQGAPSSQGTARGSTRTWTVESTYSNLKLEIPTTWKEEDLNDDASIQVGSQIREQYLIVLEDSAVDFEDGFTLYDYADLVLDGMLEWVDTAVVPTIIDTEMAGFDARQFELNLCISNLLAEQRIYQS
ncbi:MAG: hypothetical protein FWG08_05995 [Propionibacteriaceae bacterium]|nr:hypothetical protein [Propionibacteriaceae bacterium]